MGRDKARDDKHVNCSQDYELEYIANLYSDSRKVKDFLVRKCNDSTIHYSTNMEVYKLIKKELGYSIPVSNY